MVRPGYRLSIIEGDTADGEGNDTKDIHQQGEGTAQ